MGLLDNILQAQLAVGAAQARGLERKGDIYGHLFSNFGQMAASVPGEIAANREREQMTRLRQQEAAVNQAKIDQIRRAQMGQSVLAQAIQQHGDDNAAVAKAVSVAGFPDVGESFLSTASKNAEALDKLRSIDEERDRKAREAAGDVFFYASSPEDLTPGLGLLKRHNAIPPELAKDLETAGPEQFDQLKAKWQQASPAFKKRQEELNKPTNVRGVGLVNPATQQVIVPAPQTPEAEYLDLKAKQGAGVTLSPEQQSKITAYESLKSKPDKTAAVGSFEDFVRRKYGDAPTPEQILDARKLYGQADDRVKVSVNAPVAGDALTPDAIEYTATAYNMLGTRAIPTRIEASERRKILNEAAKQAREVGRSPAAVVTQQLTTKADSNAMNTLQKLQSSAQAYESKALGQADIIADVSAKVPRTASPILNEGIQHWRERVTGDENATKLANAVQTFAAEYAKIMEGSTGSVAGSSDASRKAADRLINTGMSQKTLMSVLDQMKREMRLTLQGYDVAKASITERLGTGGATQPSTVSEEYVRDKNGRLVKKGR